MSVEVSIDAFEGPLDLLLHLITKEEIDIYDIPIVKITSQYMAYLNQMPEMDLEVTTEFLVMAASLLEIKSKMLLPEHQDEMALYEYAESDPRRELVRRLVEYKIFKDAALKLREKEGTLDEVAFKEQEELTAYTKKFSVEELNQNLEEVLLQEAMQRLIGKMARFDENRKNFFKEIKRDLFTVEEKIDLINDKLLHSNYFTFEDLFHERLVKEEVVVTFLAVLELLKLKVISITQDKTFDTIHISRKLATK